MKNYSFLRYALIAVALCASLAMQAASSFVGGRTDFRDESIYFLMTTRFYDGDPDNNVQCWDGQSYNEGDPAWRGDFKGLIEKLDYIKALGFTAIWITPVVENCSGYDYHGYHAMSFKRVDGRYLSENVGFQELIDAVHAKDMKLILDVVFNHTGNFGEETLCPMFEKDYTADLSDINAALKRHPNSKLPENYDNLASGAQYQARLALMKNTDGVNHDTHNYWHHFGHGNWDDLTCQWMQIAGDCVDLNTENPAVLNYLIECYGKFIRMGVDGFRIDTGRHISRLVFNKVLNEAFMDIAREVGKPNFFMFSEICTRFSTHWYRNQPAISTPFYTWKESKEYEWSNDATSFDNLTFFESTDITSTHVNQRSCTALYNDNAGKESSQPTSKNVFLDGNNYHTPDYSRYSNLSVIDFPMHWNFKTAEGAFNTAKNGDATYNDASFNVVYVDSHDYAPDHAPEDQRFAGSQDTWAENLCLMYTFRGIPCLYYGSEIEFKKGCTIDKGPNMPLRDSGRAYYGGYIKGEIQVSDFAQYSNASGNMAVTLKHPLALHIQRLSQIRMAVPALRKGQYSTNGCSGKLSFKRRYTDNTTDSYALVTISGSSTFSNILNGTYTDVITGDVQTVTNNTLSVACSGKGNMRVYVLTTEKTKAPGKIGFDGKYLYNGSSVNVTQGSYDGTQEELSSNPGTGTGSGGNTGGDDIIIEPCIEGDEQCVFFEKPSGWGSKVYAYAYYNSSNGVKMINGSWPGKSCQSLGNSIYKFSFPDDAEKINEAGQWYILFSDGAGNQTKGDPGFECKDAAYYNINGYSKTITASCSSIVLPATTADEVVVYTRNSNLYIDTPYAQPMRIYSIDGRLVEAFDAVKGVNIVKGLPRGMYLVNGKKAIVK